MLGYRFALLTGLCLAAAHAFEISGTIRDAEDGRPIPGAVVRLQLRGDSTLTDAEGLFRIEVGPAGLVPSHGRAVGAFRPRIRGGRLEFRSPGHSDVFVDLFGIDGRMVSSLRHRMNAGSLQGIPLERIAGGYQGVGWLRLRGGGRAEWATLVVAGARGEGTTILVSGRNKDPQPEAAGSKTGEAPADAMVWVAAKSGSEARSAFEIVDTLRVEKTGYYGGKYSVADTVFGPEDFAVSLRRNSLYGLSDAEVEAWKAHLSRPAMTLNISKGSVTLPAGLDEGVVILADGSQADRWSSQECNPGPRPTQVCMAYSRGGRHYRDTLDLDAYWKFIDSFRAERPDSLGGYSGGLRLSWDWPQGISATPERDWMTLLFSCGLGENLVISYPDVFQSGGGQVIDGGTTRYEPFNPAIGSREIWTGSCAEAGFSSTITLAAMEEHDLRVKVDSRPQWPPPPVMKFTNSWPADGIVRPGQVIRLQYETGPPEKWWFPVALDMLSGDELREAESGSGFPMGTLLKHPFDEPYLDWSFPYPLQDTLRFRLRVLVRDPLGTMRLPCQVPGLSPSLRAVPAEGDTAVPRMR